MEQLQTVLDAIESMKRELSNRLESLEQRQSVKIEKESYRTAEVATFLTVHGEPTSAWTVRRWCELGLIPEVFKDDREQWRVPHEAKERLLHKRPVVARQRAA